MTAQQELLKQVVDDFNVLYRAYDRAGLLIDNACTATAQKLLGSGDDVYRFARTFLLADALIRHRVGRLVYGSGGRRHLAVFGGNNVGKSTVINILAGEKLARTSVLGGYTRHPYAFFDSSSQGEPQLFGDNPHAFCRFGSVPADVLAPERFDQYGTCPRSSDKMPRDVVLWDTPDCDTTESHKYMHAVAETVVLADVIVYVTSIERFAVGDLIEWVFVLHDAGIDLVECLNRVRLCEQQSVKENQRTEHFPAMAIRLGMSAPDPPIVGLRPLSDGEEHDLWGPYYPEAAELRDTALARLASLDHDHAQAGAKALDFVTRNLEPLLRPFWMEVRAKQKWVREVEAATEAFVTAYTQGYLQSDTVIDPFTRLNLEILDLLDPDIPGLRKVFKLIRRVRCWPGQLVSTSVRRVLRVMRDNDNGMADKSPEFRAYSEAHRSLLTHLDTVINDSRVPPYHRFWDALSAAWTEKFRPLSEQFDEHITHHMRETDYEIKRTAREIVEQLQQKPLLLNTLRGVRVAANIGGAMVGFLFLVQGVPVYDLLDGLVLTPVLLNIIDAAAAAGVASFVDSRRKKLVETLQCNARVLAIESCHAPLLSLADEAMEQAGTLGVDTDILERLPRTLERLQEKLAATASR